MDRSRRLSILDGLILVAAVALGLAPARAIVFVPWDLGSAVELILTIGCPLLFTLGAGALAVRLRRPRPARRRLFRLPGTVAIVAGLAAYGLGGLLVGVRVVTGEVEFGTSIRPPGSGVEEAVLRVALVLAPLAGLAVAVAWLLQALGGTRRPDPGEIDRLGRAVGWGWIAAGLVVGWFLLGQVDL